MFSELTNLADLKEQTKPTIVKFETDWCGWCRRLTQELERLEPEFGQEYTWFTANVDNHPSFRETFNITTVPTMIKFHDGVPIARSEGVTEAEIRPFLEK